MIWNERTSRQSLLWRQMLASVEPTSHADSGHVMLAIVCIAVSYGILQLVLSTKSSEETYDCDDAS